MKDSKRGNTVECKVVSVPDLHRITLRCCHGTIMDTEMAYSPSEANGIVDKWVEER